MDVFATRVGQAFGAALVAVGVVGPFVGVPYVTLWTALMGVFVFRIATAELRYARAAGRFVPGPVIPAASAPPPVEIPS